MGRKFDSNVLQFVLAYEYTCNMHIAYEIMLRNTHTPNRGQTQSENARARKRNCYCVRQRIKIDQCRVHGKYFNVIEMHTKERARFSCIHILASLCFFLSRSRNRSVLFKINEYKSFAYVVLNNTTSNVDTHLVILLYAEHMHGKWNKSIEAIPTNNFKINRDCANAIGTDWISAQTNMPN